MNWSVGLGSRDLPEKITSPLGVGGGHVGARRLMLSIVQSAFILLVMNTLARMAEYGLLECWRSSTIAYIDIQKMPLWALQLVRRDQTRKWSAKLSQPGKRTHYTLAVNAPEL